MIRYTQWLMWLVVLLATPLAHAGTKHYYYTDPQGTPLAEADASGNITARFEYTPYGVPVTSMGAAPDGVGYTGHVNDPETGLVYMQARYYDAEVGRFLSVDPVRPAAGKLFNFNRYGYANDNPVRNTDPFGLYTCDRKANADFCNKVDTYVDNIAKAKDNLQQKFGIRSKDYRSAAQVLTRLGKKDDLSGPNFVPGTLKGKAIALSDQNGTITLDPNKTSDNVNGAAAVGHEVRHYLDAHGSLGFAGNTTERTTAKQQFTDSETSAYDTTNAIFKGFGRAMNSNQLQGAINDSVTGDLKRWDENHPALKSASDQNQ